MSPVQQLERADGEPVQAQATRCRDPLVQRVANEDVLETETPRLAGDSGQNARGCRLVERVEELVLADPRQALERVESELAPEQEEPASPCDRIVQALQERPELLFATDEAARTVRALHRRREVDGRILPENRPL